MHGRVKDVNVLVNNAGVGGGEVVQGSDVARWKKTLDTNLFGMYLVSRQILPLMATAAASSTCPPSSAASACPATPPTARRSTV